MKFKNPSDLVHFLIDVNRLDLLESDNPATMELVELFIKRRKPLVQKMKNFRKSQRTKQAWRQKRFKFLMGISRFHRSIKGKRMHRALGRFIATRIFKQESIISRDANESLKAISSIRTHIYIEADYYRTLQEEVEFQEFVDYAIPLLGDLESKLFEDSDYQPSEDELELLLRIVPFDVLEKVLEEVFNVEVNLQELTQETTIKVSENASYFMLETLRSIVL